jgi:cation transport ATPase
MTTSLPEAAAKGRTELALKVGGLRGPLAAVVLERALREQPGVDAVSVDLAQEQALIGYDPARVRLEQLQAAASELGFPAGDASGGGPGPDDDRAKLVSEGRRLLALIALSVVTVPLMLAELLYGVGGWVPVTLGALAVAPWCWRRSCSWRRCTRGCVGCLTTGRSCGHQPSAGWPAD